MLPIEVRQLEFIEIRDMKRTDAQTRQGKDMQAPYPAQSGHCDSLPAQHGLFGRGYPTDIA